MIDLFLESGFQGIDSSGRIFAYIGDPNYAWSGSCHLNQQAGQQ